MSAALGLPVGQFKRTVAQKTNKIYLCRVVGTGAIKENAHRWDEPLPAWAQRMSGARTYKE